MTPKTKALTGLKITDADKGLVSAVFATFNVKDHDGDVTMPGAFVDGAKIRVSAYGHKSWEGLLPVGRGSIHQDAEKAWAEMEFFMDAPHAAETFAVVKGMGELQEWSYSLHNVVQEQGQWNGETANILKSIHVEEVSPVLLGAGIDTRTLAVKGRDLKFSEHVNAVVADVDLLITRACEVKTLREGQGKSIGGGSLESLASLKSSLTRLCEVLTSEPSDDNKAALTRELARVEMRRATEGV